MKKILLVIFTITFCFLENISSLNIPKIITYQGKLTNANGTRINGNLQMQLILYDVPSGGVALWLEENNVTVINGIFNVELGSIVPLNLSFDKQYWLGIKINGEEEMMPRTKIKTSPYAFSSVISDTANNVLFANVIGDTVTKSYVDLIFATKNYVNDSLSQKMNILDSGVFAYKNQIGIDTNSADLRYAFKSTVGIDTTAADARYLFKSQLGIDTASADLRYLSKTADTYIADWNKVTNKPLTYMPDRATDTAEWNNVNNRPAILSVFQNDSQFIMKGSVISQLSNDSQFVTKNSNISNFLNDSGFAQLSTVNSQFLILNSQLLIKSDTPHFHNISSITDSIPFSQLIGIPDTSHFALRTVVNDSFEIFLLKSETISGDSISSIIFSKITGDTVTKNYVDSNFAAKIYVNDSLALKLNIIDSGIFALKTQLGIDRNAADSRYALKNNIGIDTAGADTRYAFKADALNTASADARYLSITADTYIAEWNKIINKPLTYPPSAATDTADWNNITNKPLTFTPNRETDTAEWNNINNRPVALSAFQNDSQFINRNSLISQLINDSQFIIKSSAISQLYNDSLFVIKNSNISNFINDSNFIQLSTFNSQLSAKLNISDTFIFALKNDSINTITADARYLSKTADTYIADWNKTINRPYIPDTTPYLLKSDSIVITQISHLQNDSSFVELSTLNLQLSAKRGIFDTITADSVGLGNINNIEFNYLDGLSSNIQSQLNSKVSETNPVFAGGIKASDTFSVGTDTFVVLKNGKIGIGTTNPDYLLHIVDSTLDNNAGKPLQALTATNNTESGINGGYDIIKPPKRLRSVPLNRYQCNGHSAERQCRNRHNKSKR